MAPQGLGEAFKCIGKAINASKVSLLKSLPLSSNLNPYLGLLHSALLYGQLKSYILLFQAITSIHYKVLLINFIAKHTWVQNIRGSHMLKEN